MRIIAGKFKGRTLHAPRSQSIRPTSDRLRETLFNILAHGFGDPVADARVLDLFAGTGALGLEALSRGANFCLFVDEGVEARGLIRTNIEALGLTGASKLYKRNATKLGDIGAVEPFDLAFCDPPYGKGLGDLALRSAHSGGWLKEGAIVVLEESSTVPIGLNPAFMLLKKQRAGDSTLHFYRVNAG